ncbi:hypothetical protein [Cellvibrio sp. UBA7661]|uniref:hypothetical protein n=1 Tax=Cellvibrio sp. UBA7661 TaxID=1946311 RepID=UPI002F355F9F
MKYFFKSIAVISIIPLLIALYFFDNIKGYWRFKQYCASEGGLRVYQPLERGVGWLAEDQEQAKAASLLEYVDYARYTDKNDGNTYDLRYLGGDLQLDASYEIKLEDQAKNPVYLWKSVGEGVKGELRLRRFGYEVVEIKSSKLFSLYYSFSYSKFDRSKTILDSPSRVYCFTEHEKGSEGLYGWRVALNTAFKN